MMATMEKSPTGQYLFFIHQMTPNEWDAAPFIPAPTCQYLCVKELTSSVFGVSW